MTRDEMHVLAGVLDGVMSADEVMAYLDAGHFTDRNGRTVFELIRNGVTTAAAARATVKDPETLAYIDQLQKIGVNRTEMMFFIERLKISKFKRECIERAQKVIELAQKETTTAKELADVMFVPYDSERGEKDILLPEKYAKDHKKRFLERMKNPDAFIGLSLEKGFPELNRTFMGFRGGDLIMICAKSGHGKTALALNLARELSVEQDYVTYYMNAEMDDEELSARLAAQISGVTFNEIYTGKLDPHSSWRAVERAYDRLAASKLVLSKIPVMTVSKVKGFSRIVKQKMSGLDCLIVDYVGRMEYEGAGGLQEYQQLYQTVERLKTTAVELDIPIIVLAQLNEEGMVEGAKKMKNACDGVLFFEPIEDRDKELIERMISDPVKRNAVNYKLTKYKVRRNDNTFPIWCRFSKKTQKVGEVE